MAINYEEAIKRPFTDVKKLLIGTVIEVIPLVDIIGIGYKLECARTPGKPLPEWDDWGKYFVDGLKGLGVSIIYLLPALLVLGLTILTSIGAIISAMAAGMNQAAFMMVLGSMGIGGIIAGILGLIAAYLIPLAYVTLAIENDFAAALSVKKIMKKCFTGEYFIAWLIMIIYSIIVMMILSMIPAVGTAIAVFITGVSSMTVFAEYYGVSTGMKEKSTIVK